MNVDDLQSKQQQFIFDVLDRYFKGMVGKVSENQPGNIDLTRLAKDMEGIKLSVERLLCLYEEKGKSSTSIPIVERAIACYFSLHSDHVLLTEGYEEIRRIR